MLRQIKKLTNEPAFRAAPLTVLSRAVRWAFQVLTRTSPVFTLTPAGERLKVPADMRYTSVATFLLRDWSEPELRALDLFLKPGDRFVDVGANIGLYTLKGASLVGSRGRVVAVEPGAQARRQLADNLALNALGPVDIIGQALSDQPGEAVLHHVDLGGDPQAFSLLAGDAGSGETVAMTTLDLLVDSLGLDRVDCIKIDVEGYESHVIAGASSTLARWKPTIVFEINCPTLLRSSIPPEAAWQALAAHGYAFFRLEERSLIPLATMPADFGNIVARHPERD